MLEKGENIVIIDKYSCGWYNKKEPAPLAQVQIHRTFYTDKSDIIHWLLYSNGTWNDNGKGVVSSVRYYVLTGKSDSGTLSILEVSHCKQQDFPTHNIRYYITVVITSQEDFD